MTQSIVALFNSFTEANAAKTSLLQQGFSASDITVRAHEGELTDPVDSHKSTTAETHTEGGFMQGVENFFSDLFGGSNNEHAGHYSEAVRRGGAVVTVTVDDDSQVKSARSAMAASGAVDIDERVAAWRDTGYVGYQKNSPAYTADQVAQERARVIPIIQEEIEIGKRQVNLGTVRVVSRVVERPVAESVTLREEHAVVERHPVDRPASQADLAGLQGQSIEVRETAEQAVVAKTAHVVEEVVVGTETTTHTEEISDTVRRTVVDIEQLGPDGTTGSAVSTGAANEPGRKNKV